MKYEEIKRSWFNHMYDDVCSWLTHYEEGEVDAVSAYDLLVKVQTYMCRAEIDEDENGFMAIFR